MASHDHSDKPLSELKHDPIPGYRRAFLVVFAVLAVYLAAILISSPGSAKSHYGDHGKADKESSH